MLVEMQQPTRQQLHVDFPLIRVYQKMEFTTFVNFKHERKPSSI